MNAGRFDGRIAVVTGGASGFGRGIAERFVREGARVAILDIDEAGALRAAHEIGGEVLAVHCDVARLDSVARAAARVLDAFGGIDILVNNAGTSHRNQPMLEVSEEEFDRVFAVNVKSIYNTAKTFVPVLRRRGRGVIVNIGSTAGIRPRPGLVWYNASKAAVNALTRAMAIELAPDRIRVVGVAPVAGDTPLLPTFMGGDTPELRAKFLATIPWGRFSRPEDVAAAVAFLASDEAEMITGAVLEVDGGRCI
ncbi:4-formylbenzenesulfonate dehydrogenase TsaC1/TsaC2 [bacterium HR39]|nr:4-formylbenzenesulfonate dehydrogenase TsaC1/TsaC2 [bacterium HR39]